MSKEKTLHRDAGTKLDWQSSTLAVNGSGSHCVIATRKFLGIVDIESLSPTRKLPRSTKFDVTAIDWNSHSGSSERLIISTSSQHVDLWNVEAEKPLVRSVKGHTRAISDLSWCPHHPALFVSCSADTYVHIWDTREFQRPVMTWKAVAGASQVKWNRHDENFLASSHDGDVRVWDRKRAGTAVTYIAAHTLKTHGLDWSRQDRNILASASQDSTVKLWDVKSPRTAKCVLSVGMPVWRAKFTPFGSGVVTLKVPQLRREEHVAPLLWSLAASKSTITEPVDAFDGHTDSVPDFAWRVNRGGEMASAYQLVTWSKDQTLRLWKISAQHQTACGHDVKDLDAPDTSWNAKREAGSSSNVATENASRKEKKNPDDDLKLLQTPHTLSQEFALMRKDIPGCTVERLNAANRTCTTVTRIASQFVRLCISFPELYPNKAVPSFQFSEESTIDTATKSSLKKALDETAQSLVNNHRPCLEACLRRLVTQLEKLTTQTPEQSVEESGLEKTTRATTAFTYGSSLDAHIPFPRTSGACFCANGLLVVFTRPHLLNVPALADKTPRALADLGAHRKWTSSTIKNRILVQESSLPTSSSLSRRGTTNDSAKFYSTSPSIGSRDQSAVSLHSYYHASKRTRSKINVANLSKLYVGPVVIRDLHYLLPFSRSLAESYRLNNVETAETLCQLNALSAANEGRQDLVQMWQLLELVLDSKLFGVGRSGADDGPPWAFCPFGRDMIMSILEHYEKQRDVQTLAMITSVICLYENDKWRINSTKDRPVMSLRLLPEPPALARQKSSTSDSNTHLNPSVLPSPSLSESPAWNYMPGLLDPTHGFPAVGVSSWNHLQPFSSSEGAIEWADPDEEQFNHLQNGYLLDPSRSRQYDEFRRVYADVLLKWGLLEHRLEVLKHMSNSSQDGDNGIGFCVKCSQCGNLLSGAVCERCRTHGFRCSICRIPVKGSSSVCLACGHGGHVLHMRNWFTNQHVVCPSGCGCTCLESNPKLWKSFGQTFKKEMKEL